VVTTNIRAIEDTWTTVGIRNIRSRLALQSSSRGSTARLKPSSIRSANLTMPSATTLLRAVSLAFGTIPVGFAINWYFSTASGLSFFYQTPPVEGSENAALVDCMATVIGVRNLVLGLAMVSAALFNEKKTLGVLFLSFAVLAVVDGIATNTAVGQGGSDHIGYAPVVTVIGIANLWTAGTR
jgi:hypothetical protein